MDNRIFKSALAFIMLLISSLLIPILTKWYEQQTGIFPIGFLMLITFGGVALFAVTLMKIWGGIK